MSRSRRSPTGALAAAVALAGVLATAPALAAGSAEAKAQRTSPVATVSHVKNKTTQAMPGPRRPGWVESVIGKLKPRPPKFTCRG